MDKPSTTSNARRSPTAFVSPVRATTEIVHQIFYVSRANSEYDSDGIQAILESSRRNNPARGVTGCLLFSGTLFSQVLEGESSVIVALTERIASDPRHRDMRRLVDCVKPGREYADWSMGYLHDLELEDALAALLLQPAPSPDLLSRFIASMRPDKSNR